MTGGGRLSGAALALLLAVPPAAAGGTFREVPVEARLAPVDVVAAGAALASPLGLTASLPASLPAAQAELPFSAPGAHAAQAAGAAAAGAQTQGRAAAVPAVDLGGVRHIVFDVRGSRGGHGDVAAGYLTAGDVVDRVLEHKGREALPQLTFIADHTERGILSRLTGGDVYDGARILGGHAQVLDPGSVTPELPRADLYMSLAASEGEFGGAAQGVRFHPGTIFLTQTVLGNTESAAGGPATAWVGGRLNRLQPAGLRTEESGVYGDPVARRLR
ncbi:MAG: hypothetical protein KGL53_17205, partial [Elusimicrobia bacterium]|nr:hypothetical protein [Elusimicrobiota bacterium]